MRDSLILIFMLWLRVPYLNEQSLLIKTNLQTLYDFMRFLWQRVANMVGDDDNDDDAKKKIDKFNKTFTYALFLKYIIYI